MNIQHLEYFIEAGKIKSIIITSEGQVMEMEVLPAENPDEEDEDYLILLSQLHLLLIDFLNKTPQYDSTNTDIKVVFNFSNGSMRLNGSVVNIEVAIMRDNESEAEKVLYRDVIFLTDIIEVD